jgi:hypothetical protein
VENPYLLSSVTLPDIPSGWTVGPPDYVGVGTMKTGTTRWWSVLNSHPKVANPKDRVRNCYSSSDPGAAVKIYASKDAALHMGLLAPPMLRAAAPDGKLLVLLRDPLDRFISGLAHHLARGLELTPTLQHHHFSRGPLRQTVPYRRVYQVTTLLMDLERPTS